MNFSESQIDEIFEFISDYNADTEFKNKMEDLYDNHTSKLKMTYIYALEILLKYGMKSIYETFMQKKGKFLETDAVDLYDDFMRLCSGDELFVKYKMQQLEMSPDLLSEIELFALNMIKTDQSKVDQSQENIVKKLGTMQ